MSHGQRPLLGGLFGDKKSTSEGGCDSVRGSSYDRRLTVSTQVFHKLLVEKMLLKASFEPLYDLRNIASFGAFGRSGRRRQQLLVASFGSVGMKKFEPRNENSV